MKPIFALIFLFLATNAFAIENGVRATSSVVGVMIRQDGGICTATLVSKNYALTAAHCLRPAQKVIFKIGLKLYPVTKQIAHSNYQSSAWKASKVTTDLGLLKLENADSIATITTALPIAGETTTIFGYGVDDKGKELNYLQSIALKVTGNPGRLQVRLTGKGGGCRGDSGGPAFNEKGEIIGIISWSTGIGKKQCGALTGLTPTAPHRAWILSHD